MGYKKFSELEQGDTIYFLIDRCHILQTFGNNSAGFANSNYGLIICSRKFLTEGWRWHNPRTDKGHLTDILIDEEISCSVDWKKEKEVIWDKNSYHSITKEEGEKSCLRFTYSYSYYGDSKFGYIFTTKEELEERIKEVTDTVEENLRRIKEDLSKI